MIEVADLSIGEMEEANRKFAGKGPQRLLEWAFERFQDRITMASSFGGLSGAVILDMAMKINSAVRVFYLDTDFLFPETYRHRDEVTARYGVMPVAFKSRWTPEEQAKEFGPELWKRDPDLCCQLRKVEPNGRALEDYKAWITGLRRDQSKDRSAIGLVEWDAKFELTKLNPLAEWTEAQTIAYIREHRVFYNRLYDRGYKSIGCVQCTRAVKDGEDARAGRWDGFGKEECGLHQSPENTASQPATR
jgi:phosphoadenosine phosphosulfate reductase